MAKRRAKKTVKQAPKSLEHLGDGVTKEGQNEEKDVPLIYQEVERQIAAVRAICDVEIEHMLTSLHLLHLFFSKEQQQTPALQFFKENIPNVSVVKNEVNGEFDMHWENEGCILSMNHLDGTEIHASLLHHLSMAYPHCSGIPSFGGFELSSSRAVAPLVAVRTSLFDADNLQIKELVCSLPLDLELGKYKDPESVVSYFPSTKWDFKATPFNRCLDVLVFVNVLQLVLEGMSDTQLLGMHDAFRTPGVSSQRLSIGMTPNTLQLPKPDEMLLSIHGSPLGVYKEDNMEAIRESEEG